jgi:hypothetical protein
LSLVSKGYVGSGLRKGACYKLWSATSIACQYSGIDVTIEALSEIAEK